MKVVEIDCLGVRFEGEFWSRFIAATRPDGAEVFGRNRPAFRDAITGGGPGWPGECELRILHSSELFYVDQGSLLGFLQEVAKESNDVVFRFE
jgi:ribonuclease inhibitor